MPRPDRRTFLTTAGAGALAAGLTGCGLRGGGDDAPSAAAPVEATGDLSGSATLTTWGSDAEVASFRRIAADFGRETGASVTIEVLPYDQIRTVVDRRLQAGRAPDLFRVSYTDVRGYAESGALADLGPALGDGFGDAFLPALWDAVVVDGSPVGVPHHTDTSALVYNVAHLEAAGVTSVPTSLEEAWTWDEFTGVLEALAASGVSPAPFAFNYQLFGAYRWLNTLYQAGGSLLSEDLESVTLDTPQARRALEFTRGLYTEGLHASSILVKRPTYPSDVFPTQQVSMIQAGDFLIPDLQQTVGDRFEWGVTYLMRDAEAAADLGGNAVVVTRDAPNAPVAAAFAKYLVSTEAMRSFCEATTVLPVRTDLVDAELDYAVRPDLMPVFQQQATTLPPDLVAASTVRGFPAVNQLLVDSMDQYLSDPRSSTDALVTRLSDGVERALQA